MRQVPSSIALACLILVGLPAAPLAQAPAGSAGFDLTRLARLDEVVAESIDAGETPGVVLLVGRGDTIVWRKAYGNRATAPRREAMTLDTLFDVANGGIGFGEVSPDAPNRDELIATLEEVSDKIASGDITPARE